VLIAVDVNHDYDTAPDKGKQRYQPLKLGEGMTMCVGAIASEQLNGQLESAAQSVGVNVQRDVRGRDTGTDGMAAVLASIDCAATSVGFPIRNMHTISELAHEGDVLGTIEVLYAWLERAAQARLSAADFREGHPRLDHAVPTGALIQRAGPIASSE
jgi:putative aminopeptidase FrvX